MVTDLVVLPSRSEHLQMQLYEHDAGQAHEVVRKDRADGGRDQKRNAKVRIVLQFVFCALLVAFIIGLVSGQLGPQAILAIKRARVEECEMEVVGCLKHGAAIRPMALLQLFHQPVHEVLRGTVLSKDVANDLEPCSVRIVVHGPRPVHDRVQGAELEAHRPDPDPRIWGHDQRHVAVATDVAERQRPHAHHGGPAHDETRVEPRRQAHSTPVRQSTA
mmetsp:Transcript_70113/g.227453  ORF Transcript_70113/g.227453 Transcript_70113/m.227453 type:complete len:218 (+) Transcript_70113:725-1378(+)